MENNKSFTRKELILNGLLVLVIPLIFMVFSLWFKNENNLVEITKNGEILFTFNLGLITPSLLFSSLGAILLTLINYFYPSTAVKPSFASLSKTIIYMILVLLGIAAHLVLCEVFESYLKMNYLLNIFLSSLITLVYFYFMYKLYILNCVEDKSLFFELVRFALVGVIASLFDFITCYLFQYIILPSSLSPLYITIISVTMGFIIGVIVNYLCSVYMVFKSTSNKNKAKTWQGVILFISLSAAGLFIGIGLQYLFYDFIHLSYVLTFVIRTLVVLVWNYITRKKFIFK